MWQWMWKDKKICISVLSDKTNTQKQSSTISCTSFFSSFSFSCELTAIKRIEKPELSLLDLNSTISVGLECFNR